ncbi:hypothetical protein AX14_004745 [Amanita brunnescens Koide BX004]|nr:hypothetical protein AX14_004745 [Amanita brunnescens Koide BX004]
MSTKDPLSVPILTVNFRRFVSCVGPVFWLQDRIEEIVVWKKGWKVTCAWLCAYGFFCYFPHLILCLPHIALISIILATYPYPASNGKDNGGISSIAPDQPPPAEGSVPWQANIQAIQNLMGTFSDVMDFVKPYTYHLRLTPAHLYPDNPSSLHPSTSASSNLSSSNSATPLSSDPSTTSNPLADPTSHSDASSSPRSQKRKTPQSSPYTSHMLTLLIVTLPPLAYIVSLPVFPLRLAFFLAGAAPVLGLHPWVRNVLVPTAILVGERTWNSPLPESVVGAIQRVRAYKRAVEWRFNQRWSNGRIKGETKIQNEDEEECGKLLVGKGRCAALKTIAQRVVDNDRLTDGCWQSEMREVELWENERYVGGCLPCRIRNIRLIAFLNRSSIIVRACVHVVNP